VPAPGTANTRIRGPVAVGAERGGIEAAGQVAVLKDHFARLPEFCLCDDDGLMDLGTSGWLRGWLSGKL
jgi:hypothetical protein